MDLGIPYGYVNPVTGTVTCPVCTREIAENYDATGEPVTDNYAAHYTTEH